MNRKFIALTVTILVAAVGVTTALATDALQPISSTLFARGTLTTPVIAFSDGVLLFTDSTTDTAVQEIIFGPGSSSGWHRHPGVVLVTVKSGTLARYHSGRSGCSRETVSAGQSFWESGNHAAGVVRNEGTDPVVVYVTYIAPTGASLRIDAPNPGCPGIN